MSEIPIRSGSPEQFARVREAFTRAGFHDERMTVPDTQQAAGEMFPPYSDENLVPADGDAAEVFTGLFLRGAAASTAQLLTAAGELATADLMDLGMVRKPDSSGLVCASVRVRPLFGLHVISDLWVGHENNQVAEDIVYPPDIANTATYLSYIPNHRCGKFLEACGGSGVAALIAADRFAEKAWSFDITERSTRFAEFSGKLNGLTNFNAACGDLYDPAGEERFDRIVAHPPYVPVLKPTWIYHGGGVDGEAVTRRLVEGLPERLAPGGRFLCRCVGTDRQGQNFEQRVRSWLGEDEADFDVAVSVIEAINPLYYVTVSVLRGRSGASDLPLWSRTFEEAGIVRFVSCFFVVQRRAEARPVFTVRRDQGKRSGPRELEWLLRWETFRASGGVEEKLLGARLRATGASLRTRHTIAEGNWAPGEQLLQVAHPYELSWPVEPWTVYLLPRADGSLTGAGLHALLRQDEVIHPEVTATEFASALAELVSGGFLKVEGMDWPEPREL